MRFGVVVSLIMVTVVMFAPLLTAAPVPSPILSSPNPAPIPVVPPPPPGPPPRLLGAGLITDPLPGKTVPSAGRFGLAAGADGGTLLYSMSGVQTRGFRGTKVVLIEGTVKKGSLQLTGATAVLEATVTVVIVPGRTVPGRARQPVDILSNVPISVTVVPGGALRATLILKLPPTLRPFFGGDLGGLVQMGTIQID